MLRFTDFQVNEITEDGKVVHLETIGLGGSLTDEKPQEPASAQNTDIKQETPQDGDAEPKPQEEDAPKNDMSKSETPKNEPSKDSLEVSPEDIASLTSLAGEQFAQEVVSLYQSSAEATLETYKRTAIAAATSDRSARGKIHHEVRRIFNSKIDTSTDDAGAIVAKLVNTRGKKRGRDRRDPARKKEEKPTGDYLHFTLFKDNRDTMDAASQIARVLRAKPQAIGYSGTKDRRASTAQRCSIRHMRSRALAGANAKLRGVVTGDYEYKDYGIQLGQLRGNEFVITIKNCRLLSAGADAPVGEQVETLKSNLQSAIAHLTKHGWINYFGHQRFGTHSIGTHEIGRLILGEKYEAAVEAVLHYDEELANKAEEGHIPEGNGADRDDALRAQACMLFRTGKDPNRAEEIMPRRFGAEVCVLRQLNREGKKSARDFVGALVHITRGLRTMYLHAYQSHVWNHAASKRWELHGNQVIEGDLIFAEKAQNPSAPNTDQDDNDIINPGDDQPDEDAVLEARALTAEEAASGKYTIHDIVLPTPGYEVIYPNNAIGEYYKTFMAQPENGELDPHKMRRMRREFSLPGRYRKLVNNFIGGEPSVEVRTYKDDTEQMHLTDLDKIRQRISKNKEERASKKQKTADGDVQMKDEDTKEGKPDEVEDKTADERPDKIAVLVKFQLGSSAYATVTLRELMGDPPEEVAA